MEPYYVVTYHIQKVFLPYGCPDWVFLFFLIELFGFDVRSLLWCLFSCKVNLLGSCFWSIYTVQTENPPLFCRWKFSSRCVTYFSWFICEHPTAIFSCWIWLVLSYTIFYFCVNVLNTSSDATNYTPLFHYHFVFSCTMWQDGRTVQLLYLSRCSCLFCACNFICHSPHSNLHKGLDSL